MKQPMRIKLLAVLLITTWLSGVIAAFWYFEWRWIKPFSEQLVWFNGSDLGLEAEPDAGAIVWHFYDQDCPCNRYTQKHIQQLEQHFKKQGVKFSLVTPGSAQAKTLKLENLPASPAVGIWNNSGELAYFGPYSAGVLCNSSTSFVEPVLRQVLKGSNPDIQQTNGVGCFCDWPVYL